jgi:hypothetical protein
MRPIWHKGMRPICLMIAAKHETDLAHGVLFFLLFLSVFLNLLLGRETGL